MRMRMALGLGALGLAVAQGLPLAASAVEAWGGRAQLHGFWELQIRNLAESFEPDKAYIAQWANTLNLELELDLAPNGFGPFDAVSAFARVEARYECVFSGCGVLRTDHYFGDRAHRAPARNWSDARTTAFKGDIGGFDTEDVHRDTELIPVTLNPLLAPLHDAIRPLVEAGYPNPLDETLQPVIHQRFSYRKFDNSLDEAVFQIGPVHPTNQIRANATLAGVPSKTLPLPMRPAVPTPDTPTDGARGLYVPSAPLRERLGDFGSFDQNFRQTDLEWNHGAGQDEKEIKEAYLDVDLFDGRLWLRAGKQNIVWGKTELFRTTDQFNPQDIGLASLPSLEESRLALWSLRGVWSFFDVGPLQDVRLELAANFDDFEPIDIGRCGEPYAIWLTCAKATGLFGHGVLGVGLAGEVKPPDPWDESQGIEVGARAEWRWRRFSFALTDFWGYDDAPIAEIFNGYERKVDPFTGQPLDVYGQPLVPERALEFHPSNRQIFDVFCSATVGVVQPVIPELAGSCVLDLVNADVELAVGTTPAQALSIIFAGTLVGESFIEQLAMADLPPNTLIELNPDAQDGPVTPDMFLNLGAFALSSRLTDQQEALLGCGPFYGTNCDIDGIDLFNSEASALVQSFPLVLPGGPVATRFVNGETSILPGARGVGQDLVAGTSDDDPGYDPNLDGCTGPGAFGCNAGDPTSNIAADPDMNGLRNANALALVDPLTGQVYASELAAFSRNLAFTLAALDAARPDSDCTLDDPAQCTFVQALVAVTGVRRPERRAGGNGRQGRRDFIWAGGGEALLRYPKRNVLGFSTDFPEDRTKTNWSTELSWIDDATFTDLTSTTGLQEADVYNLTISVDRPTFVNFLNPHRTFFVNSQFFFNWIPDHDDDSFVVNGPFSVLGTLTFATGYFQDRLLASTTFVHDFSSVSGAWIPQFSYRFTESFSATFGTALFYGGPENRPVPFQQLLLTNQGRGYDERFAYQGLSALSDRDEFFFQLRYTF